MSFYNNFKEKIKGLFNRKLKKRISELEAEICKLNEDVSSLKTDKDVLLKISHDCQNDFTSLEDEFSDYILESSLRFSIRRFIVGKKGSGKTVLLRCILPYLKGNYFIIDSYNEYEVFPNKNKFVPDRSLTLKKQIESIKEVITKHKDKVIIYDGVFYQELFDFMVFESFRLNFIITSQSKSTTSP